MKKFKYIKCCSCLVNSNVRKWKIDISNGQPIGINCPSCKETFYDSIYKLEVSPFKK
jgi:hypothetical protein